MKRSRAAPLVCALVLSGACPSSCHDKTATTHEGDCPAPLLRDGSGGVLVLRGANVSAESKWRRDRLPPYDATQLAWLRDELGMNAIRLLVFWEAIEPLPGVYDDAYLEAVHAMVQTAGELGMHVLVDMHQDVYGHGFGHAGAPWWSCEDQLYATYEPREPWFLGYLQREVGACFDRLYHPGPTRSAFVAAWTRLAEALRGAEGLLAYDLLNEPFWGSSSASEFERKLLPDLYRELTDAIRATDPEPWIMIEPSPAANVGVRSELGKIDRERILFGPHYYPPDMELGNGYDGNPEALREQLRVLCGGAKRLGTPMVIGEMGARRDVEGTTDYLTDAYGIFDDGRVSSLYWSLEKGGKSSYGLLDRDGELSPQGRAVARPYPRRTAGMPLEWSWDAEQSIFVAHWSEDDSAAGETHFALPRTVFPEQVEVELEDDGTYRIEGTTLYVPQQGGERRITIRPRPLDWRRTVAADEPEDAHLVGPVTEEQLRGDAAERGAGPE